MVATAVVHGSVFPTPPPYEDKVSFERCRGTASKSLITPRCKQIYVCLRALHLISLTFLNIPPILYYFIMCRGDRDFCSENDLFCYVAVSFI